jgi:DNA-binding NarL/FixJ family response regulator
MTTILVIDDDSTARAYVRSAAPLDWTVLEASDGLTGLDVVRQHRQTLDLIVLDVGMPTIDGRIICARIRDVSPTVPILPFTGMAHTVSVLNAFGCLPPILKPVRPSALSHALHQALARPAPSIQDGPLMGWAYEQSQLVEHLIRQNLAIVRVAVFATSPVKRAGLARMVATVGQTVEAAHAAALRHLLVGMRWTAIVADAGDCRQLVPLAREHDIPLILIAATAGQAQAIPAAAATLVLLESDPSLEMQLVTALEAIANGESLAEWLVATPAPSRGSVPPAVARRFVGTPISPRELEVLWLDYHGYALADIAISLAIDPTTVTSHWKRIQRKLGRDRQEVRQWMRERLDESGTTTNL